MINRRPYFKVTIPFGAGLVLAGALSTPSIFAQALPGGTLDPITIPKYVDPLIIPPVMPKAGTIREGRKRIDYYEIEVVQFQQQILPQTDALGGILPPTTVWSYAAVGRPETRNYPAFTIEALENRPVRVKWVNNLVDEDNNFLPHLFAVDQTLHWSNPPQDCRDGIPRTDCVGQDPLPYDGPVSIVTHLHGGHTTPESDGYPEAWYLPAANNIPMEFATEGSNYDDIFGGSGAGQGFAVFQYANDQPASTLWFHDHSLGTTRLNVYAGPAGFYMIRNLRNIRLRLPGPPPLRRLDPNGNPLVRRLTHEIPIVIQDRSFNDDGSLFYPDNRDFFEGLEAGTLARFGVNLAPDSDVAPIWNPEAFFNTMVVNGKTWPFLNVEPRKYRLRFLNGSDSRFLILRFDNPMLQFTQIGSDQGFLPRPVILNELLLGPAERADVVVDFSNFRRGDQIILINVGPDEPFGGGTPDIDFPVSDPDTTGQVMAFNVVRKTLPDFSRIPRRLPAAAPLGPSYNTRLVSLNEEESATETVCVDADENLVLVAPPCPDGTEEVTFGPVAALLGTVNAGVGEPLLWAEAITENPALDTIETWEIHNFTEDAHPIHVHPGAVRGGRQRRHSDR